MLNPMEHEFYSETDISQDFYSHLKLTENLQDDDDVKLIEEDGDKLDHNHDDEEGEEEEEEQEEFSFNCGKLNTSVPIAAEDAFINGQIKPVIFPLFGRDLAYEDLPVTPPVKKIFVETNENNYNGQVVTSCGSGGDEISGPYCEWLSRKAVEVSPPEVCKKSSSTGSSKIWRLKEFVRRCNSEGRDHAFVFLNNGGHGPLPPANQAAEKQKKSEKTMKIIKREVKKNGKSTTSKTASLSAHYLRSKKAKEEERRRSYLPYRPELMGFFTNVSDGLTKNVHPF